MTDTEKYILDDFRAFQKETTKLINDQMFRTNALEIKLYNLEAENKFLRDSLQTFHDRIRKLEVKAWKLHKDQLAREREIRELASEDNFINDIVDYINTHTEPTDPIEVAREEWNEAAGK